MNDGAATGSVVDLYDEMVAATGGAMPGADAIIVELIVAQTVARSCAESAVRKVEAVAEEMEKLREVGRAWLGEVETFAALAEEVARKIVACREEIAEREIRDWSAA